MQKHIQQKIQEETTNMWNLKQKVQVRFLVKIVVEEEGVTLHTTTVWVFWKVGGGGGAVQIVLHNFVKIFSLCIVSQDKIELIKII